MLIKITRKVSVLFGYASFKYHFYLVGRFNVSLSVRTTKGCSVVTLFFAGVCFAIFANTYGGIYVRYGGPFDWNTVLRMFSSISILIQTIVWIQILHKWILTCILTFL